MIGFGCFLLAAYSSDLDDSRLSCETDEKKGGTEWIEGSRNPVGRYEPSH